MPGARPSTNLSYAALFCLALACCAPQPGPAAHLAMADIQSILEPLTYREMWGKKCGAPGMAVKTAFIQDLKSAGATADLLRQAETEAGRVEALERETPNEYVCTVELSESTEKNATAAQLAWTDLKKRKS